MSSAKIPFGIKLISALHALSALTWISALFIDVHPEAAQGDTHGLFAAITLAVIVMVLLHGSIAVGLWKGKRIALFGAIALASLHVLPLTIGLVISIPTGYFVDVATYFMVPLLFHGGIIGYLAFNQNVRKVFR